MRVVDGIEIPDDFDGIDDDIAICIMKDNDLISEKQEETEVAEVTTKVESTEKPPVETPESKTESKPTEDAALVKEQETKGEETYNLDTDEANANKTVPYAALKAERDKRKKNQLTVESLQAELAQLRQQVQQPIVQQQQPEKQPVKTPAEQRKEYEDYIDQAALELFKERNDGREPDDLDPRDNRTIARYAIEAENKLNEKIQQQQQQANSVTNELQQTSQSYNRFVAEQKEKDEYDDVLLAANEEFAKLPDDEKQIVGMAIDLCESGKGTNKDFHIVRKFWSEVANKRKPAESAAPPKTEPVVTPPKPPKTAEEKLEQIEKHPKTNLIEGNNSLKDTSIDDIAHLMNTMPWPEFEKKHPEYAKLVLGV